MIQKIYAFQGEKFYPFCLSIFFWSYSKSKNGHSVLLLFQDGKNARLTLLNSLPGYCLFKQFHPFLLSFGSRFSGIILCFHRYRPFITAFHFPLGRKNITAVIRAYWDISNVDGVCTP